MPESQYFKDRKRVGRLFEAECEKIMREKGMEVIDSEKLKCRDKRGWDRLVKINGQQCRIEIKFDELSELTGNICIELSALRQSISPIWLYGLPEGNQVHIYSMFLTDLAPFAESWPTKKLVGEFHIPAALVPKLTFINQPFVKQFKVIQALKPKVLMIKS
jgi:hypothetical protein